MRKMDHYLKKELYEFVRSDEYIFDFVQEYAKDGLVFWDLENFENQWVNQRLWAVLGYAQTEMPPPTSTLTDKIHPEDLGAKEAFIVHCLSANAPSLEHDLRFVHKYGFVVWCRCRGLVLRDETGRPKRFLGGYTDVTVEKTKTPLRNTPSVEASILELKRAEHELQRAQKMLAQTSQVAKVGGWEYDALADVLYWSNIARDIFEIGPDEPVNPNNALRFYIHESDKEMLLHVGAEAALHGASFDVEAPIRTAHGNERWIRIKGEAELSEGKCIRVYGIFQDISEKKQFEIKHLESQKALLYKSEILSSIAKSTEKLLAAKDIYQALHEAFALIGTSAKLDSLYFFEKKKNVEAVACKIEWCGEGISPQMALYPGLQHMTYDQIGEYLEELLQNKPFSRLAKDIKDPSIRERLAAFGTLSMLLLPVFVKNDFYGFICFLDFTTERLWSSDELSILQSLAINFANAIERSNNERLIQESEANFRQINETIEDVFWLYDIVTDSVVYISPSSEKVFGLKPEAFYNRNDTWTEYVYDADRHKLLEAHTSFQGRDYYELEYRIKVGDEIRWIFEKSFVIRDELGAAIRKSGICVNISEIVEKRNQLQHLMDVTSDQNKRLLNFAHIVSHNIRSHSSNLTMLVDFIKYAEDAEEKDSYFEMLQQSTGKLAETIENLNEIITVQQSVNSPKSKLYVRQEIEKTISAIAPLMQQAKVALELDVPDGAYVMGIPAYFESILLNLLTNAIKYRSPERAPTIRISTKYQDHYLVLVFRDNGLGIDLEKHGHKLFGMYKTFHNNRDARGIGLFITKNQVEAMGGKIEVHSELGKGTSFSVFLAMEAT